MLLTLFPMSAMSAPSPKSKDGKSIELVNISNNNEFQASVFPTLSVDPNNPNNIAVAWRRYKLPIDTNADWDVRIADFHVAVSSDGGKTFTDVDMMPNFRTVTGDDLPTMPYPGLWFCNAPWATYGSDGTLYAGAAMFTPLGDSLAPDWPKQGRAVLAVSNDNGQTWSAPTYGIKMSKFAPGVTGLNVSAVLPSTTGIPVGQPGTDPWHTPWDGAWGAASATTGSFFSSAGGCIAWSEDGAKTFGLVHNVKYPAGWTVQRLGTISIDGDTLIAPFIADATPYADVEVPCMAVTTSSDKGETWTEPVIIAESPEFGGKSRSEYTIRYPVSAAAPNHPGKWAVTAYTPDHLSVQVFFTKDGGKTWKSAKAALPSGVEVTYANQVGVGFTAHGDILLVWRGFQSANSFHTFAALMYDGKRFGPTVQISPELSIYPYLTTQGNYQNDLGGGDFTTWITGNDHYALVAFPYAPEGLVLDTYFARVPLNMLHGPKVK